MYVKFNFSMKTDKSDNTLFIEFYFSLPYVNDYYIDSIDNITN